MTNNFQINTVYSDLKLNKTWFLNTISAVGHNIEHTISHFLLVVFQRLVISQKSAIYLNYCNLKIWIFEESQGSKKL